MAHVVGDVLEVDAEADHGRLVADGVDAVQRALDGLGVADVVAVGEIEHPDVVPVLAQRIDDVRADEAGATGDEDHGRTVGALGPRCAGMRTVLSKP